jgi:hypothetical protein
LPKCKSLVFKSGWLIIFSCWNPTIHCEAYKANLTIDGSIHHHMWWTPRSSNCRLVLWLTYNPCLLSSFAQLHCNFLHLSNRRRTGKTITIVAQPWKGVSSLPFCISPPSLTTKTLSSSTTTMLPSLTTTTTLPSPHVVSSHVEARLIGIVHLKTFTSNKKTQA